MYHTCDPTAQLLAIDHMPEHKFHKLIPAHLCKCIIYYRCDLEKLMEKKYSSILRCKLNITPTEVTHVHASPPCESFSVASRCLETVKHYLWDKPNSLIAIKHSKMLHNIVNTLNRTHTATSGTVVSLENPVSKCYKTLEIWEQLLKQPGWTMFTADHCMPTSCMDADPIFLRKPTTWICCNAHNNIMMQAKACSKHRQRC